MDKFLGVPLPKDFEHWDYMEQVLWKDGVSSTLQALEMDKVHEKPECPYTHSHTRFWCGYDTCRES
jgi:hypothetical protein